MRELGAMLRIDLDHLRGTLIFGGFTVFFWIIIGLLGGIVDSGRPSLPVSAPMFSSLLVILMLVLFHLGRAEDSSVLYATLPLRRRTVVISGYLTPLILLTLAGIVVVVLMVGMPIVGVVVDADWSIDLLTSVIVALFLCAVIAPLIIRFRGETEGLVVFFVLLGAFLGVQVTGGAHIPMVQAYPLPDWLPPEGLWVLLVVGLVTYAASLLASIRIYERQDH